MIINELHMMNFKSYKDTTISFNEGVTIITGENGAGKSTIFEAIHYALYKKNTKNTIRNNQDNMLVELTFTEKGNTYKVKRTRTNDKNHSQLYQYNTKNDEYELLSDSNTETDNMIKELTSMDSDLFLNAIYIKQGEITDLISKTASERKKLISRLLGVDVLEGCWESMLQIINTYNNKESMIEGRLSNKSTIEEDKKRLNDELVALEKEYDIKGDDENKLMDEKHGIIDGLSLLSEQAKEHTLLCNSLENEEREFSRLRNEMVALSIKHKEMMEIEGLIHMLEEQLSRISVDVLKSSITGLGNETNYCKQQNKELSKRLNELEDTEDECPVCKSKIQPQQKQELEQEYHNKINQNKTTIKDNNEKIKVLEKQLKETEDKQTQLIRLNTTIEGQEELNNKINENQSQLEKQKTKKEEINNKLNQLQFNENEYAELKNQEKLLTDMLNKTIEEKGIIQGKIKQDKSQLIKLEKQLKQFLIDEKELENVRRYIKVLEEIRETYGKNGVQRTIRATVKPLIQQYTKENFERFNFSYNDLKLDEDYHITIDDNSVEMLSGGEQISISLALRLGITKTISKGKMECLLLDEPTNHLDSVRVGELSNLLGGIDIVPQVLIVTHEQELERIADTLIKIVKNDGVSEAIL